MKYYIEKKDFENDGSFVSYLDETWKYGDIKTPDDLTEFKIELFKKERINMSDKAFTTVRKKAKPIESKIHSSESEFKRFRAFINKVIQNIY
jgi:DNA-directed RNA polymerase delta subunit